MGRGLKIAGIVLIVAGGLVYAAAGGVDDENPGPLLGALLMVAGILMHFRGRQQAARARAVGPQSPLTDSKPDVLYLRSFSADPSSTLKILQSGFTDEEEQLAEVLRPFGDLVAIGRSGERLPLPGATRMYASDDEWQSVVLDRMRMAPLVVIRAGSGQGLLWELGQAVRTLNPERVLILVLNITAKEYATFAGQVQTDFGLSLPALERFGVMTRRRGSTRRSCTGSRVSYSWRASVPRKKTQHGAFVRRSRSLDGRARSRSSYAPR